MLYIMEDINFPSRDAGFLTGEDGRGAREGATEDVGKSEVVQGMQTRVRGQMEENSAPRQVRLTDKLSGAR